MTFFFVAQSKISLKNTLIGFDKDADNDSTKEKKKIASCFFFNVTVVNNFIIEN